MDVFFYETFEEEVQGLKRGLQSTVKVGFTRETIQEHGGHEPPASVISIRTQSVLPTSWAPKITGILTRSTGYDHIEAYLKKCKVKVSCGYLPLYCSRSVAEQAMVAWMSLMRKLPRQIHNFKNFNRDGLMGQECEHKTLLVVGVGNIGYEVVRIGRGLGMEVLGVDIVKKHASVTYVSIKEGLPRADVIVCAMNLTSVNRDYFNYRTLKRAKAGTIFINIARGELSPTVDLLRLLDEDHLGGISLDVYHNESELAVSLRKDRSSEDEQVRATLAMAGHPDVILTPHNAFNTREAVERKVSQSVQQIEHFLEKAHFLWPVPV